MCEMPFLAGIVGLEPAKQESKSCVLPLHHIPLTEILYHIKKTMSRFSPLKEVSGEKEMGCIETVCSA